ncbi:hypothetical protein MPER_06612, partial [Moniliophthora perniciosa FA553]
DSADKIFDRLGDAGFSPDEVVDLLIAHTIGGQEHVDESVPNTPFDTTPETFDSQFFVETLLNGTVQPPNGIQPGGNPISSTMQTRFRDVMAKLALLGQKRENLVDCSEIIPTAKVLTPKPFLPARIEHEEYSTCLIRDALSLETAVHRKTFSATLLNARAMLNAM